MKLKIKYEGLPNGAAGRASRKKGCSGFWVLTRCHKSEEDKGCYFFPEMRTDGRLSSPWTPTGGGRRRWRANASCSRSSSDAQCSLSHQQRAAATDALLAAHTLAAGEGQRKECKSLAEVIKRVSGAPPRVKGLMKIEKNRLSDKNSTTDRTTCQAKSAGGEENRSE